MWESFKLLKQTATTPRSCRFATVWTGMLNLSNKIFEKESRDDYGHPTGIIISELEYSWNLN